eukprot:gene1656-3205_t
MKGDEDAGDEVDIPESEKSPITIITGFLGAGKTTLVNYILKEQRDKKICVLENEFGEVSIDDALVEENMTAREDVITMDNGCVCCSIRGDLIRTFGMLVERRKEFDAFILETTGLADPAPILFTFSNNTLIQENYRVDSVVCLVDAKHVGIHLDEIKPEGDVNEAEHQIAFADRIMLNKCDLVSADELEDVMDRIRSINSFAEIIKTEKSRAPLDKILNLNSFSLEKLEEMNLDIADDDEEDDHGHSHEHVHSDACGHGHDSSHACTHESHAHDHNEHKEHDHEKHEHGHDEHDHDHGHDHGHDSAHVHDEHCGHKEDAHDHNHHNEHKEHEHDHHDHKEHTEHDHQHKEHAHEEEHPKKKKPKKKHNLTLVTSVGFTITGDLDVTKFNFFMSELLQSKAKDLYRTKGVLAFHEQGDTKFVFQGVHEQINFGPTDHPWRKDEVRLSKLVFIGKNLECDALMASIKDCIVDVSTAKITMHKRT